MSSAAKYRCSIFCARHVMFFGWLWIVGACYEVWATMVVAFGFVFVFVLVFVESGTVDAFVVEMRRRRKRRIYTELCQLVTVLEVTKTIFEEL